MTYSDWQRWKGCERKQRFSSGWLATNWATLLGWRYGRGYEAYLCRFCAGWHVATVRQAEEAA